MIPEAMLCATNNDVINEIMQHRKYIYSNDFCGVRTRVRMIEYCLEEFLDA